MSNQPHPPAVLGPQPYVFARGPHDGDAGNFWTCAERVTLGILEGEVYENTGRRDQDARAIYEHQPNDPDRNQFDSLF